MDQMEPCAVRLLVEEGFKGGENDHCLFALFLYSSFILRILYGRVPRNFMLQVLQSPRTYAEPDSIGALTLGNCAFVVASVNSSCQFGLLTSSFPVSKEKAAFLRFPPGEFGVWAAPSDSRQMLFCHFLYYARWSPFDTQPNFSISSSGERVSARGLPAFLSHSSLRVLRNSHKRLELKGPWSRLLILVERSYNKNKEILYQRTSRRSYSQLTEETETPYSLHVPVTERVATSLVALLAGYD